MKAPAYQMYAQDFDMDTASWPNISVGIYQRLLNYEWVNGGLPADPDELARIVREKRKIFERNWIKFVSKKFHENGNGFLVNNRMEEVRLKQEEYFKSQSESGLRGIEVKKEKGIFPFNKSTEPLSDPSTDPSTGNQALQSSSSSSSFKDNKKNKTYSEFFLNFWNQYPNKKGKEEAFKAWRKHTPDMEVVIKAVNAQKEEKVRLTLRGKFCPEWPNASTWLNNKRWEDEIITEQPTPSFKENRDPIPELRDAIQDGWKV